MGHSSTETGGRFRIWLQYAEAADAVNTVLIWDRKTRGGFPELKEVVCGVYLSIRDDNLADSMVYLGRNN